MRTAPGFVESFDLIVVGTGTGLDIAVAAAEEGWRVAIVEKAAVGGTCLNRGCIPSKLLIHSADVARTLQRAKLFGIEPQGWKVDLAQIMRRVNGYVDGESAKIREGLRASENPRYFEGEARFVAEKTLEVAGQRLRAERFLLATGARPRIPPVKGLADVPFLTSDDALRLTTLPRSLVILGGGYIAAELAHFYGSLGTEITIVQRPDLLLNHGDKEIAEGITAAYRERGFRVLTGHEATAVRAKGQEIVLEARDRQGQSTLVRGEKLLVAVGLTPNSDSLNLPATGVRVDERGYIAVDDNLETSAPGIFALGDAIGRFNLKHSANHEADYALWNLRNPQEKIAVDYTAMPMCVFGSPQVASVGETEEELRAREAAYLVGRWRYRDVAMGHALEDEAGFVKLLVERDTGKILGCHILGTDASTLLHVVLVPMRTGATVEALQRTIYVHPALPEVIQRAAASLEPGPSLHVDASHEKLRRET